MNSKETILTNIAAAKVPAAALPAMLEEITVYDDPIAKFTETAIFIGAKVFRQETIEGVKAYLQHAFFDEVKSLSATYGEQKERLRVVTTLAGFTGFAEDISSLDPDAHRLKDVDIAIMQAAFGVAENGALWVPEEQLPVRVLPFICQHLVVLVSADQIVHHLHDAYAAIGEANFGFATFIAGPSKTADIEQSLVLGAHGPRSLSIFLVG